MNLHHIQMATSDTKLDDHCLNKDNNDESNIGYNFEDNY